MARMPAINVDVVPIVRPPPAVRLTLTSGEVATMIGYLHRDGRPNRWKVYTMARTRKIPSAIDPALPATDWRWARREIEAYCRGEWQPAPTRPQPLRSS
jgi:hypothetical protein